MRFLRSRDLIDMGLVTNKMTLHRLVMKGAFPAPIKVGRANLWRDTEINSHIDALTEARDRRTKRPEAA